MMKRGIKILLRNYVVAFSTLLIFDVIKNYENISIFNLINFGFIYLYIVVKLVKEELTE